MGTLAQTTTPPSPRWRHGALLSQLTRRDISGRYRGSALGVMWSILTPLLLLALYTFVFTFVFQARWGYRPDNGEPGISSYALLIFSGLIIHSFFAECLNRAPHIILHHVNFVKKVVFPLEILPVMVTGTALFHNIMSLIVLLAATFFLHGMLPWTVVFLPLIYIPFVILALGLGWMLAALGVYLRDIGQLMGLFMTILMFASPVFYPVSALPESIKPYIIFNPLTFIIEQTREVLLAGHVPDFRGLVIYMLIALVTALIGLRLFQTMRRGFADVL